MTKRITKILHDYKILFRSLPCLVVTFFVLSVVLMNLMANRIILQFGEFIAGDGGFLLSWIPFLCMDTVTKRFGAKASIMLNIFGAVTNVLCTLLFVFITKLPSNGQDFSAFNEVFGTTWFVTLSSTLAYIISGILNSVINESIGNLFKCDPDGKVAFFTRSYISTFVGQWVDNFLFAFLTYHLFSSIYWGWSLSTITCILSALVGGSLELILEALFSPLGYQLSIEWAKDDIGTEWIDYVDGAF